MTTNLNADLSTQLRAERLAVDTLYRAFNDNQPDLVDTVLAPDWDDIPLAPGQVRGPAGIKMIIASLGAAFGNLRVTVHDMVQEPGKVGVRAEISGTHQGVLMGIAPTGREVQIRLHEFHVLKDGLITTTWHMEDWFGMFMQLGQFPPQA